MKKDPSRVPEHEEQTVSVADQRILVMLACKSEIET
jgi:hypothetical protein